jgi:hypothetical protein
MVGGPKIDPLRFFVIWREFLHKVWTASVVSRFITIFGLYNGSSIVKFIYCLECWVFEPNPYYVAILSMSWDEELSAILREITTLEGTISFSISSVSKETLWGRRKLTLDIGFSLLSLARLKFNWTLVFSLNYSGILNIWTTMGLAGWACFLILFPGVPYLEAILSLL